ncbi:uncharacterized protein LOC100833043 isoform X2 [Brachypodium distachyon]|uniref:uncharacterized protein LOC100833043 isoform X2 n=1 Tax=Brachypodium distachyon TaxID=15368 RepID=UPI000D0DF2FA|nr:uncharacterized protein LOC100833043 isoform X2 [Brachypodium distachyon]|eukprot:XP_024312150.1 uncharacterized protein LOC100833043 isoform X2 [Brachypodium distachyon]
MSSPKNNGTTRRPFHDISNTNPEGSTPSLDPKALKSQKNKEYYARNRDAIRRRRHEALEKKQASAAMLKDTEMSPHTPMSKAEGESHGKHTPVQDIGTNHNSDPKERRRQRDRERYALNRYEILNRRHQAHENKESPAALNHFENIVTHTPAIGQSVLTQLQQIRAAGMSKVPNSSQPHDTIMHDKENINCHEEASWLHRNDAYQIQEISGRRRAVLMPSRQNQQNKCTVIRDSTQGLLTQLIEVQTPQLNQESDKRRGMEESPDSGQPDNNERNDETDDVYGIFEPAGHSSDLEDDDDIEDEETLFREHVEYESVRDKRQAAGGIPEHDSYDSVYRDLPREHHVLRKVRDCGHCEATRFQYEGPAFCCRKGKIRVFIPDVPEELKRLWTSQDDDDAKYFRENIRYFNSHFSFTSLGVTLDRRVSTAAGTGIFTFRAHGMLYHKVDDLVPTGNGPRHLQLYIYDGDQTLSHRIQRSPDLNVDLIQKILSILEHNPYVHTFKTVGSFSNLDEYKIELNTNITLDQRRYNAPTTSEVAAIWVEGNDPTKVFDRSVVVHAKGGGRPLYIRAYYGCYDPLAYPLFFPGGETGWNRKMPYFEETNRTLEHLVDNSDLPTGIYQATNLPQQHEDHATDSARHNDQATDLPHEDHTPDTVLPTDDMDGDEDEDPCDAEESKKFVSAREYYCYKLQVRKKLFNIILFGGRLFQQWAVDMYIKIETMRLDWYSKPSNQKIIRADLYQGLVDTIAAGEARGDRIGKRIVLPRSFPGGDRDMQRRFLDAMAIVHRWGKPDYFITMTCNPYWEEITTELLPGQLPQDRPDLVARVYRAKQRHLMDLLTKQKHFGEVAAYVHVTEFQKRGLPHEHILLIMKARSKLNTPDDYDKVISAQIPDKDKYPVLHDLVIRHMLHGPCDELRKSCACMIDGQCRFHYPRQFCPATQQGKDSYPIYRRRDDGQRVQIRGAYLDNRWVVPYNPSLLMRYNCHINVEACSSIKAVKYLFKYIYKGHDRTSFAFEQELINGGEITNEIRQYRDARYVSPPEAIYRIFGFHMFGVSPSVLQLQLHLPNMHTVAFKAGESLEDVVTRPTSAKSMLTEYFEMNAKNQEGQKWLYREFPEHYRWISGTKKWQKRRNKRYQIGRLVYAHPAEGERYYLRVLLSHVRGATSFDDLKTANGRLCGTFREACEQLGLIEHDRSLDDCRTEAATFQMPCALRRLFATILVFCEATEIRQLWDKHLSSMSEDYRRTQPNEAELEQMVLRDIRDLVQSMGKDIKSYELSEIAETDGSLDVEFREVAEERQVGVDQEHLDLESRLNNEQLAGFNDIMDHVTSQKSQVFFVDGPGGTGKTYLYKALLAKVRSMGLIAIATATSGIAASIMPGGRTAHSRFKIPIKLTGYSMCGFTKQSGTADLLRRASLIIWDEVAMTKRQAVETLDRSLQDIMECPLPFGGKVVVFGGDFRQVLPVVTRGTRAQITDAALLRSHLWENIRKIRLTRNMRAQDGPWFSEYLLRIGNGTEETIGDDYIRLPDDIVIGYTEDDRAINRLIEQVFPSLHANARSREYMSTHAILSTKNEHVDELNAKMISRFPGEEKVYHSFDSIEDDLQNNYTIDFLNSITPNGLPPHVLRVKDNCPVILLRNLDLIMAYAMEHGL